MILASLTVSMTLMTKMAILSDADSSIGPMSSVIAAGFFTVGAGILSYPLDTANKKAMTTLINPELAVEHPLGFGIFRSIIRKEGIVKGFYGGISVHLLSVMVPIIAGVGLIGAVAMASSNDSKEDKKDDDDNY